MTTLQVRARSDELPLRTLVYVTMAIILSAPYGLATIRYGRATFRLRINSASASIQYDALTVPSDYVRLGYFYRLQSAP